MEALTTCEATSVNSALLYNVYRTPPLVRDHYRGQRSSNLIKWGRKLFEYRSE